MTSLEEAKRIAEVLDAKKAQEVKVLKVADLTFVAEYFVLATGTSSTQVKSLICHIFEPDARSHYNLERLWADAEEIEL